jgi:hypothetical protein
MNRAFGILILILSSLSLFGQNRNIHQWVSLSIQHKPIEKLKIDAEIQYRFNNDGVIGQRSFASEAQYQVRKPLSISAHYRFSQFPNQYSEINQEQLANAHRWGLGIEWDVLGSFIKKSFVSVNYRLQWQSESYLFLRNKNIIRQRIQLAPNWKKQKCTPYIQTEWFYRTNQNQYWLADDLIVTGGSREWRHTVGIGYKFNEKHKIQLFAMYREFDINKKDQIIFGLNYNFKINERQ